MSVMSNILRGAKNCFDNALDGSASLAKETGNFLWSNAKKMARETAKFLAKNMEKYYKKTIDIPVKAMQAGIEYLSGEDSKKKKEESKDDDR